MGGVGSGNRWRWGTKPVCEQNRRIDIRYMRRRGWLVPGLAGTLTWTRGGERDGWIRYRVHYQSLELNYRFGSSSDGWTDVQEHIPFEHISQPFGGSRIYLTCRKCSCRCEVLYGGAYFRCRKCNGLAYASQNADALDRIRLKAEKIRARLGGDPDIEMPFPNRPKGMHERTYKALMRKGKAAEADFERSLAWHMARLAGMF